MFFNIVLFFPHYLLSTKRVLQRYSYALEIELPIPANGIREFQGKLRRDLQLPQVLKVLKRIEVKYNRDGRLITIEGN